MFNTELNVIKLNHIILLSTLNTSYIIYNNNFLGGQILIKKKYLFLIMLVSLFAISAVSAAENITDDIVSIEETADDFVNVEFSEIKNCNVNNNGSYLESIMNDSNNDDELLYSFNDDDLISSADENILGASYGVSISCDKAVVTLGSSVTVSIDISPYSYGNYYSYDFVVDVCNSYGSARISSDRYYSNNAYGSKRLYYTFTTGGLDVGEYTLKVVDYMNYRTVFATLLLVLLVLLVLILLILIILLVFLIKLLLMVLVVLFL